MNSKTASNPHHPTLLFANSDQFQTLLANSVWLFPFLQVGNSNTQVLYRIAASPGFSRPRPSSLTARVFERPCVGSLTSNSSFPMTLLREKLHVVLLVHPCGWYCAPAVKSLRTRRALGCCPAAVGDKSSPCRPQNERKLETPFPNRRRQRRHRRPSARNLSSSAIGTSRCRNARLRFNNPRSIKRLTEVGEIPPK
jgi:hypothetical protein